MFVLRSTGLISSSVFSAMPRVWTVLTLLLQVVKLAMMGTSL